MSEANNCLSADMSDEWRGRARRDLDRRLITRLGVTCRPDARSHALRTSIPPFGPRDPSLTASGGSREARRARTAVDQHVGAAPTICRPGINGFVHGVV
jgi:hypothetical protein